MLAHQLQGFVTVAGLHQLFQCFVAFFLLFFLFIDYLAANKREYCQSDKSDDSNCTSEVDNHGYEEADGESRSGGKKPTANNA